MYSSWWKRPRQEEKKRGERSKSCKVITQIREFDWTEASRKKRKRKEKCRWGNNYGPGFNREIMSHRDTMCFLRGGRSSHKFSYFSLHYRRCCQRSFGVGAALGRHFLPPLHSACTPQHSDPLPDPSPPTICCKTSQRTAAKILLLTPKISLRD